MASGRRGSHHLRLARLTIWVALFRATQKFHPKRPPGVSSRSAGDVVRRGRMQPGRAVATVTERGPLQADHALRQSEGSRLSGARSDYPSPSEVRTSLRVTLRQNKRCLALHIFSGTFRAVRLRSRSPATEPSESGLFGRWAPSLSSGPRPCPRSYQIPAPKPVTRRLHLKPPQGLSPQARASE